MDYNHSGSWGGQIPWPCVFQTYPRARTHVRTTHFRVTHVAARACTGSPACNALQGRVFKCQNAKGASRQRENFTPRTISLLTDVSLLFNIANTHDLKSITFINYLFNYNIFIKRHKSMAVTLIATEKFN